MRIIVLFIIELLFVFSSFAQIGKVEGKIQSDSINLEFANVLLLSNPDSSFVTGVVTDKQGKFEFLNMENKEYILKISHLGYEDLFKNIVITEGNNDLGTIYLKLINEQLGEVIVSFQKPLFQLVNSGLVANVSGTLLSNVGTANDVIERLPGIILEDEKITVFGKGVPLVYINNRKILNNQELEHLESSEIETIELINNPGAKYDAEGRAVLQIKTKKSKMDSPHKL